MIQRHRAVPASLSAHVLGEGPVWDAPRQRLLWVDVASGHVLEGRLEGSEVVIERVHQRDGTVGAVVCSADGRLLIAGAKDLVADGAPLVALVAPGTSSRLNDGGCDPAGRFLVGSLALDGRVGQECLYRLEIDGTISVLEDNLTLSNGLAWSPNGERMYSVDSVPGIVWVRDYDVATGAVGAREELLGIEDGAPDGLCVDSHGNLWLAVWGAGEVRCFSPSGSHVATVSVDAPHTTSVAFVGPDLDRLLITTAREGLSHEELMAFPSSGRLFLADVGCQGLPTHPWSGF